MGIASLLPMGLSLLSSAAQGGGGGQSQQPGAAAPQLPQMQPFMTNHPLASPNPGMMPSMLDPLGSSQSILDLLRGGM